MRWVLGAVFVYGGAAKIPASMAFAASVARFQLLPNVFVNPVAVGLPPLEIILGVALIIGPWKRQAAFGVVTLSAVFLVALITAAGRGLPVECSCFGASAAEPVWALIVRDFVIAGVAFVTYGRLSPARSANLVENRTQRDGLNPTLRCLH